MSIFEEKVESLKYWIPEVIVSMILLFLLFNVTSPFLIFNYSPFYIKLAMLSGMLISMCLCFTGTLILGGLRHLLTKKEKRYFNFLKEFISLCVITIILLIAFLVFNAFLKAENPVFYTNGIKEVGETYFPNTNMFLVANITTLIVMALTTILIIIHNSKFGDKEKTISNSKIIMWMILITIFSLFFVSFIIGCGYWYLIFKT